MIKDGGDSGAYRSVEENEALPILRSCYRMVRPVTRDFDHLSIWRVDGRK